MPPFILLDEAKKKIEKTGGDPSSLDKGGRQGERVYSIDAVGVTICASSGGPGAKTGLYKVGNNIRRLNVKETLGMFGFANDYKFPDITNEDALFYLGNSYLDSGQYQGAIDTYKKRIQVGGWKEEIWYCYYSICSLRRYYGTFCKNR